MLLELKNIKKHFVIKPGLLAKPRYVKAVNDVDLAVKQGENLALVGESGSGKTTLGRIIIKLLSADSGRIVFEGQDITGLSGRHLQRFRKNIQMVFQDPFSSLDPRFTIRRVVGEAMIFDKTLSRSQKEDKIKDIVKAVQLPENILNRYPHEFSGGERQRIAIARALIMNPRLLILDEAVSSLDVLVQEQIIQLLKQLQARFDLTYLFISHNLKVVRKLCQRIAVMYQGKIVELALAGEILKNPLHPYTQRLLTAALEYKVPEDGQEAIIIEDRVRLREYRKDHFVASLPERDNGPDFPQEI